MILFNLLLSLWLLLVHKNQYDLTVDSQLFATAAAAVLLLH